MTGATQGELDQALAHLRQSPAPGYRPPPVVYQPPPLVQEVPQVRPAKPGGWDPMSIVVTALAAVLAVGGLGMLLSSAGEATWTAPQLSVAAEADAPLAAFTYAAADLGAWTDGAILSYVEINDGETLLQRKPYGQSWEILSVVDGIETSTPTSAGDNVFDNGDFSLQVVANSIETSFSDYLLGNVVEVQIHRTGADGPVIVDVTGDDGTVVTWDALSGDLISVA